jgi:activator of 2-hydroxyglutaryl-CoA dehydratase
MQSAGIDIGSREIKLVLVDSGSVTFCAVEDAVSDPLSVCRRLLAGTSHDTITATVYGRHLFKAHWPAAGVISEITDLRFPPNSDLQ